MRDKLITPEIEQALAGAMLDKHGKPTERIPTKKAVRFLGKLAESGSLKAAKLPKDSAVNKAVAELWKRINTTPSSDLDKPWTMGSLGEYPIVGEALTAVVEIQRRRLLNEGRGEYPRIKLMRRYKGSSEYKEVHGWSTLSIRNAQWVACLYYPLKQIAEEKPHVKADVMVLLDMLAEVYSHIGRVADKTGIIPCTYPIDKKVFITRQFFDWEPLDQLSFCSRFTSPDIADIFEEAKNARAHSQAGE